MKNNIEELIKELDIAEREIKIYVIRELGNSGNKKSVRAELLHTVPASGDNSEIDCKEKRL